MVRKNNVGQIILNIIFILIVVATILPFVMLVVSSFTSEANLNKYGYSFIPRGFDLSAYRYIFLSSDKIIRGYGVTVLVTAIGTTLSVLITILFAYPLSRREMPMRMAVSFIVFFTMLFNGGLVPTYIMWTQTFHIRNTIWALIIPGHLMSAFYVIMMRSFFNANIPDELIEAARIDGAREFKILFRVVVPLSKPMLATIGLMIGLGYWNDWTNSLYYISNEKLFSIQAILNTMITNVQFMQANASQLNIDAQSLASMPSVGIRMAIAVIGVLPVLIIYTFVQKYFVRGIVVGGIKG